MKRVGVLLIHGMGDPPSDFAAKPIAALQRKLGAAADGIAFGSCWWSPILQRQQGVTWGRLLDSPMRWRGLRHWVVSSLGDPVTYLGGYLQAGRPVYDRVHECLRDSLGQLESQLGSADKPLVILAHSLGGVVVSNYLWDEQRRAGHVRPEAEGRVRQKTIPVGRSAFERLETLTSFVTFGCNIPLFLPAEPPVECVRFPGPALPAHLARVAAWKNVYDEDDLLGYPIANIWDRTHGTRIDDVAMDVGWWPASATTWSHIMYLDDRRFLGLCADEILRVLHAEAFAA